MIDPIDRNLCSFSKEKDLEHLHTIKDFPVFMGCVSTSQKEDIFFDMSWAISKSSGLVQLDKLIPLDILYQDSHGSGNIGKIWSEHHESFAKFIYQYNPKKVLEIGGGHGKLSKIYESLAKIDWTIIEPNPNLDKDNKTKVIKGFFDKSFKKDDSFDTFIHSHVFEHVYDVSSFMEDLNNFSKEGDKLIFSLPNLEEMVRRKYSNALNFEHTVFLTEPYIEALLANNSFKIIKKKYFMEDHSIFYYAEKIKKVQEIKLSNDLYKKNKKIYLDYISSRKKEIENINIKINSVNSSVFLFGAHIFSQELITMGLNSKKIKSILDNDQSKQGKRLYGTNLYVDSPECLESETTPLVVLKAGVYNKEIKKDILQNINPKVIFLE